MIINATNLDLLFKGFNTSFTKGLQGAPSFYKDVAMVIPSTSEENIYGWLGQIPKLREWVGSRIVNALDIQNYALKNILFESTVGVPRTKVEDDNYGLFSPLFEEMGRAAGYHPDELVFSLLADGFSKVCYDDNYFFATDHLVGDGEHAVPVSNMQAGSGAPWFLLDTNRPIKPLLFQERMPYQFQAMNKDSDPHVFYHDQYEYGIRARVSAGFGLWQLAFASKDTLDPTNYAAARSAMMAFKSDAGRPLGIMPNKLIVGPSLEQDARKVVKNELVVEGGVTCSNEWAGSIELVVVPWLT